MTPAEMRAELIAAGVLVPAEAVRARSLALPGETVYRLDDDGREAAARHIEAYRRSRGRPAT